MDFETVIPFKSKPKVYSKISDKSNEGFNEPKNEEEDK